MTSDADDSRDFSAATFERALTLASKLGELPEGTSPAVVTRDRALAEAYERLVPAVRALLDTPAPDLETLRAEALLTYGAIRERWQLREPPPEASEPLPFDDEDARLAGLGSCTPEWVKHVRHTHVERRETAWCGVRMSPFDYAFLDIEHAAYDNQNGGRLVPCVACVEAIATALRLRQ